MMFWKLQKVIYLFKNVQTFQSVHELFLKCFLKEQLSKLRAKAFRN